MLSNTDPGAPPARPFLSRGKDKTMSEAKIIDRNQLVDLDTQNKKHKLSFPVPSSEILSKNKDVALFRLDEPEELFDGARSRYIVRCRLSAPSGRFWIDIPKASYEALPNAEPREWVGPVGDSYSRLLRFARAMAPTLRSTSVLDQGGFFKDVQEDPDVRMIFQMRTSQYREMKTAWDALQTREVAPEDI
jgi:hypothetical protein